MAVISSETSMAAQTSAESAEKTMELQNTKVTSKRNKEPGIRVVGGRIYDPQNGKTCHQCRQKTMDFAVSCTQLKKDKVCTIKYCHKCLVNRYGENAEEMEKLGNWICPRCRGVCNCSFCMKKKGHQPTGILTHTAKASGFSSVLELLDNKGPEILKSSPKVGTPQKRKFEEGKENKSDKKAKKELFKKPKNKSSKIDLNSPAPNADGEKEEIAVKEKKPSLVVKKHKKIHQAMEKLKELEQEGLNLPSGTHLSVLADIELAPEETGLVLQFLEFSRAFSKVLDMKKGQAECIIQEIIHGRVGRRALSSVLIKFQINLISLIQTNYGEKPVSGKSAEEWLKYLSLLIEDYKSLLPEIPFESFNEGITAYDDLESTQKFQILNFLCDEALCTEKFRSYIEDEKLRSKEETKLDREKLLAAKRKERELKEKLRNDMAKNILSESAKDSLTIEENQKMVMEIKELTNKAHADLQDTMDNISSKKQRRDAMRTESLYLVANGKIYYKLDGYVDDSSILLQVLDDSEGVKNGDKWFSISEEDEKVIDMHISSVRKWQDTLSNALKPPRKEKKSVSIIPDIAQSN